MEDSSLGDGPGLVGGGATTSPPGVAESRPGRTLIWSLLSTGAPRNREEISFRGNETGQQLTASPTAACDFRMTASACRCTKHLSKDRPPRPEDRGDCGSTVPRPRNLSVPPRRPFKAVGSAAHSVPVRSWLGGRAAARRSINTVLSWLIPTGSRAGGSSKQRGPGLRRQRGFRTRSPQHAHTQDAHPSLAPVRPAAPRHSPVVPASGGIRRVFEASTPRRPYVAKKRRASKTSCLRSR
jgi:hypothetical protein